nr:MAG TPA: hypothetical protein [Caudoviricetes sp.]
MRCFLSTFIFFSLAGKETLCVDSLSAERLTIGWAVSFLLPLVFSDFPEFQVFFVVFTPMIF